MILVMSHGEVRITATTVATIPDGLTTVQAQLRRPLMLVLLLRRLDIHRPMIEKEPATAHVGAAGVEILRGDFSQRGHVTDVVMIVMMRSRWSHRG